MIKPQNVFLVGPMGAGKSAVGRQLARVLHFVFIDSDDVLYVPRQQGETRRGA